MLVKIEKFYPDYVSEDLASEAHAMKQFFLDPEKYRQWVNATATQYEVDFAEAEKACIYGIVRAHKKMIQDRGEEVAEWFKDYVGLQKFFDAYNTLETENSNVH